MAPALAVPPDSRLLERIGDADRHRWKFPVIVHPAQEHAGKIRAALVAV